MAITQASAIERIDEKCFSDNIPFSVLMELTHRCNLKCVHCYINQEKATEMTLDEIKGIMSQLAEMGTLNLTLTGGEVLLRKDILEILRAAADLRFAIGVFTNGTLMTETLADEIAGIKTLKAIDISLYGTTRDSHEYVTGVNGSFESACGVLKKLSTRGIRTNIKFKPMRHNLSEVPEMQEFARRLGATVTIDPYMRATNEGGKQPFEHMLEPEELALIYGKIENKQEGSGAVALCHAGRDMAAISPNGEVYPCVALPVSWGSLKEQSFEAIWHHSPQAKEIRELTLADCPECRDCEKVNVCHICIGRNFCENRDLTKPSRSSCAAASARLLAVERMRIKKGADWASMKEKTA